MNIKKVLTQNIVLILECLECDHTQEISIEELTDHGEPECSKCTGFMTIGDEVIIKN